MHSYPAQEAAEGMMHLINAAAEAEAGLGRKSKDPEPTFMRELVEALEVLGRADGCVEELT